MGSFKLIFIILPFLTFGQLDDSLIAYSERLKDTTVFINVREDNFEYKYKIENTYNKATFTLLEETKLYTDYRKIGGLSYFFGTWALMLTNSEVKKDKVYHFGAGYSIATLTYCVTKKHRVFKSIAAATIAGILKEVIIDRREESVRDGAWTGVGGYFGAITIPMVKIKPYKIKLLY